MKKPRPLPDKLDERHAVNYGIAEGWIALDSAIRHLGSMAADLDYADDLRGDVMLTELVDIQKRLEKIAFSEHPIIAMIDKVIDHQNNPEEF